MLAMGRSCRDSPAYWVPSSLFCLSNMWCNHPKLREIVEIYFFWFWVKLSTSSFIIIPQTFPGNPRDPPIFADLELRGGSEITDGSLFIVQLTSDQPPPSPALRSEQSHQILYFSAFCEFCSPFKRHPLTSDQIRFVILEKPKIRAVGVIGVGNSCIGSSLKSFHSKPPRSHSIRRLQKQKTAESSATLFFHMSVVHFQPTHRKWSTLGVKTAEKKAPADLVIYFIILELSAQTYHDMWEDF